MALAIAVGLFVVLLIWGVMQRRAGGGAMAPRVGKSCQFERVDPDSDRTLQEYRCTRCGEVAYGRVNKAPAQRTCKGQ